jgi:hypothetical protein
MNTTTVNMNVPLETLLVANKFLSKFTEYRQDSRHSYSEWTGSIDRHFSDMVQWSQDIGTIELGKVTPVYFKDTCSFYIHIVTKVGKMMLHIDSDTQEVKWECEECYSICQSAKDAGFGETKGVITNIAQLNHIFNVADSYQ